MTAPSPSVIKLGTVPPPNLRNSTEPMDMLRYDDSGNPRVMGRHLGDSSLATRMLQRAVTIDQSRMFNDSSVTSTSN